MIFLSRTRIRKYANMFLKLSLFIFVHRRTGQEFGGGEADVRLPDERWSCKRGRGVWGILPRENFEM